MARHKPLVERSARGVRVNLITAEQDLLVRLMRELKALVQEGSPDDDRLRRLFPTAYHADAELDAEYHRLMREELVASRLSATDAVEAAVRGQWLDEAQTLSFMQSINSVRLVLGTMLDIGEDDDVDLDDDDLAPEVGLYHFLSALLDVTVRALSHPDGRAR